MVAVEQWLREQCAEYGWGLGGVFRSRGDHAWPLVATGPEDLEAQLLAGGHILPLPKEPAALANVLEVGIVSFLIDRAADLSGSIAARGTERGYPDVELGGEAFGGGFHAIDIKVARRAVGARSRHSPSTRATSHTCCQGRVAAEFARRRRRSELDSVRIR